MAFGAGMDLDQIREGKGATGDGLARRPSREGPGKAGTVPFPPPPPPSANGLDRANLPGDCPAKGGNWRGEKTMDEEDGTLGEGRARQGTGRGEDLSLRLIKPCVSLNGGGGEGIERGEREERWRA